MYASNSQLRKEISNIQWGSKLSDERGGKLHHELTAPALSAEALIEAAEKTIGRGIKQTTRRPEGNYIIIDCDSVQHRDEYPVYLEVPAKLLPGLYAHTFTAALVGHFAPYNATSPGRSQTVGDTLILLRVNRLMREPEVASHSAPRPRARGRRPPLGTA